MRPVLSSLALALAMSAVMGAGVPAAAQTEYRSFEDIIRKPNSGLRMEGAPPAGGTSFQEMLPSAPSAPAAPVQNLGAPPAGGSSFQQLLPSAPEAPVQSLGAPPSGNNPSFDQILPGSPSPAPVERRTDGAAPPAIRVDNPGTFAGAPEPTVRMDNPSSFVGAPSPSTRMPNTTPR